MPTVGDRIAQLGAEEYLEPCVEPPCHPDSDGYRPGKSALQAMAVTRQRCWRYDWVVAYDLPPLFDRIDHALMRRVVKHHTEGKGLLLSLARWLNAPRPGEDGQRIERTAGTPPGGVVSPLLTNLWLHAVFDKGMARPCPDHPWARYADDGVVHCRTEAEARPLLAALQTRFKACGLARHPDKTRLVSGKDADRRGEYPETRLACLGDTFGPDGPKTAPVSSWSASCQGSATRRRRPCARGCTTGACS
jgi:RNA-directed DNA polymerase